MLEGAKSIGAGAATIALGGIISFLFLSYFFPMTTRNGQIKNFISNSSSFFYFFIFKYPSLLLFIKVTIFFVLVFYRFLLPLVLLISHLDCASFFLITVPPGVQNPQALAHLEGLNFYLSLYEQDPEWVAFIQQELNHNTPLEDIPGRLRLFLIEEKISCLRRDLILDFISVYNRSATVLPLEPYILEEAVRSYLSHINAGDNLSILRAAYQDLQENEGSIFFLEVVSHNQDYLDAQTTSRRCHELAQRIRWDGIARSQAQLERAEYEHARLLFQYEDLKRGRGDI
jgi:hypothetical protein